MQIESRWHPAGGLSALLTGSAHAAPIDGEPASNAAVFLFLLGVGAILLGLRNLRELRHKRLVPARRMHKSATDPNSRDSTAHG
jgi:hypothetical protein